MMSLAQSDAAAKPLPVETRPLAAGVFMARVGADVVILDLTTDSYACLPHLGEQLCIRDAHVEADLGMLGLLVDAGLVGDTAQSAPQPPLVSPTRVLVTRSGPWSLQATLDLFLAAATARRIGPTAPVRILIDALPERPTGRPDAARVAAVTAAFTRLLPWVPGQCACLYRAFLLLFMLRRAGQNAAWVFGVRTWPFSAHCWLQIGDAVLDDDPERVSRYTPIMVL